MRRLRYLFTLFAHLDYKQMLQQAGKVGKVAHRPAIVIFFDMIWCGARYRAGYMDYVTFQFYRLNAAQRASYITRGINDGWTLKYDDKNYMDVFSDKIKFNTLFAEYVRREWIGIDGTPKADVIGFLAKHGTVIAKPIPGGSGVGVEKLTLADFPDGDAAYQYIIDKNLKLLEQLIVQTAAMAKLNPGTVNTVRPVTFIDDDGTPHLIFACIRIGTAGNVVDNVHHGGLTTPIDLATGTLTLPAANGAGQSFDTHPDTGAQIRGMTIPDWPELTDFILKVALIVPQMRYVGWDIALTDAGPEIIEGNDTPSNDLYQRPAFLPDGYGLLPRFRQLMH